MPDYMFLLVSRLSAEQRAVLMRVQELAESYGINAYLVGGAVRESSPAPVYAISISFSRAIPRASPAKCRKAARRSLKRMKNAASSKWFLMAM